ncbi:ImuA family protein [Mycoplana ramosa]|uniref:ImuA family protein n=1 Tax=Mycoplana ramosa TaxID=40837 RepID=A0ABW3Z0P0_MYCRA
MATPALAQRRLFALRETIARIENADHPGLARRKRHWQWDEQGAQPVSESGETDGLDAVFDGNLPACGLVEIRNAQTRDMGAATGFSLALAALRQDRGEKGEGATLWIGQAMAFSEAGTPYAPGLRRHGLDPTRVLLARPRTIADALWMAETALGVPAFSTVILEIRGNPAGFGLTESRRLQLRARENGILLLLLRQAGEEEASSALCRLRIDPAPAGERPLPDGTTLEGSIANPVFLVTPEKSKTADPVGILLEWNSHDRRFHRLEPRPAVSSEERRPADPLSVVSLPGRRSRGAAALGSVVAFKGAS